MHVNGVVQDVLQPVTGWTELSEQVADTALRPVLTHKITCMTSVTMRTTCLTALRRITGGWSTSRVFPYELQPSTNTPLYSMVAKALTSGSANQLFYVKRMESSGRP